MQKKILLIADANGFMVSTIQDNLRKSGYEVVFETADIKKLSKISEIPPVILIYLGNYIDDAAEAFVYIKDKCLENEYKLFLIGDNSEFKDAYAVLTENVVMGTFQRPLNAKEMIETLDGVYENISEEDKKKSILVVDDDGIMLRTIKSWLAGKYRVTMANSAMTALTYMVKNRPDLILLDYEMPVCTGAQALEMIRNEPTVSDVPVIFLTAKGDKESVTRVLALKPQGYLLKTMKSDEIVAYIDNFFNEEKVKSIGRKL